VGVETVTNVNEVLDGHVTLEVECVDRMLLNAYVPNLQVGGQVVRFLCEHLGNLRRPGFSGGSVLPAAVAAGC